MPGNDLIVLCRSQGDDTELYRVTRTAGYEIVPLEAQATGMHAIRVDDVTGDGLDDVIAVIGNGGSRSLIVFRQCSTRPGQPRPVTAGIGQDPVQPGEPCRCCDRRRVRG